MKDMLPVPCVIEPLTKIEAIYGKATLLTDEMIAQLLDALKSAKPTLECQGADAALWRKLMSLWAQPSNPVDRTTKE